MLVLLSFGARTAAQILAARTAAQTVRVTGKVWNGETNTPLPGASVILQSSDNFTKGGSTDVEGRFFLPASKGATYVLKISSIGFVTKTLDSVIIGEQPVSLDIVLESSSRSLQQVIVMTSARKASVASLYAVQKNSSSISDGISADIIKRSPDKNTGDVLKRVSGASVQDNKFVIIRGMSERYNTAMLNNTILPSTEADKRAFAFNILPSSLVDNVVIYKAATPDLPGDFSGGVVKVQTRDFPGGRISELSFSVGYNDLTTGKNFYTGLPHGKMDGLGYPDDSRLIPAPYYRQRGAEFITNDPAYKKEVMKLFPNTFGYEPANKSLPNISASYTGGNTKLSNNGNKLGYIFSAGYSTGRALSERIRDEYEVNRILLYSYNTNNYDEKNNLSALLNLAWSYGRSKISLKNLYYNEFVKTLGLRRGINRVNQPSIFYYNSLNNEVTQQGLVNSVLEGMHQVGPHWSINWSGSFSHTYKEQPDQKILTFRSADDIDGSYYLSLNNENSPNIRNAGRVYSFLGESIYGAAANVTKVFNWRGRSQKLQFGTLNNYRDRSVEVNALGYASLSDYGVVIPETKETGFANIFSPVNIDRYNLTISNIGTSSTDYTAKGLLNAGYIMLDNKFSDRLKLTWGARVEKYSQQLTAKGKNKIDNDNTDILPSFLLTWSLDNRTNLRVSGSQAVNRPEFRELADYNVYDYDNFFSITGNRSLKRARNTNADLRYEYFPAAGEILSASLFYKYFTDPIEQTNKGNDVLSYDNADNAYVYGAEVEIRKKLDFTSLSFFDHLTFYVNAAYIRGGVQFNGLTINSQMQGQSPYLFNGGLTYMSEKEDFSINVLYNRIGPRLRFRATAGNALNIFEKPRDALDAQISKKVLRGKLEIRLTVSDIFAQAFRWYYKYDPKATNTGYNPSEDRLITSSRYGTTATLGVRLDLGN